MTAALLGAALGIVSFAIAFAVGIRRAVLAVFLVRSSCDPLFELTKAEFGTAVGAGGAMNAVIISFALLFLLQSPVLIGSAILPWAGFIISAFASAIVSPDSKNALRTFLWLASYAAVFALPFGLVRSGEWALRCLMVVLYSSLVPVAYAFVEFASGNALSGIRPGVHSTFTHPNIFAFYLVILLSLVLFMLRSSLVSASVRLKRLLILYLPIIVFALLLTGARSPWIAAAIVVIIYASTVDKRYLLCLLLVPFIVYVPGVEERLLDLQSGTTAVGNEPINSYTWRQTLWQETLDWMMARPLPLFGYGLASFEYYVPLFFTRASGVPWGVHNIYLQIFFEMGIFGLLTFAWLFVVLLTKLKKGYSLDRAGTTMMLTLALCFLIVSYSDNMLDELVVEWYFWFLMGVFCAWNKVSVQRASQAASYDRTEKSPVRIVSAQQGIQRG